MARVACCSLVKQAEAHVIIFFLLFRLLLLLLLGFLCSCATASSCAAATTAPAAAPDCASNHHLCRIVAISTLSVACRLQPICLSTLCSSFASFAAAPPPVVVPPLAVELPARHQHLAMAAPPITTCTDSSLSNPMVINIVYCSELELLLLAGFLWSAMFCLFLPALPPARTAPLIAACVVMS